MVKAIEQSGLKEGLVLTGEQKLQLAIQDAQKLLDERGLKNISADTIATVIRAALRDGVHKEWPIDAESLAQIEAVQYLLNGEIVELQPLPPPNYDPDGDWIHSTHPQDQSADDDDDTVEIDLRNLTPASPLDTH